MTHEEIAKLRERARNLPTQNPTPEAALALVVMLKKFDEFGTARLMLQQLRKRFPDARALALEQSLCTYKDTTLDTDRRYREALAILKDLGLTRVDCTDKEILGQGGAIYKRMWETSGTLSHLHTALGFYLAGWKRDPASDLGWCGVNATYVLDQLAYQERRNASRNGHESGQAQVWQTQAKALREDLLARLPALQQAAGRATGYWAHATLAEVHFGLGQYEQAQVQLGLAAAAGPDNWARKSTARQLIGIARLQGVLPLPAGEPPPKSAAALRALRALLGDDLNAALHNWHGKVGLALSGGGFRASLFHLGVLARLAECDVLRSVETLSTVSGGSILGAQYYLALRRLLQSRPDSGIQRQDYAQLVRGLIDATVAGVAKNLRVRALSNLGANLRMVFDSSYSRSMRMGELYERYLLAPRPAGAAGPDVMPRPAAPMQPLRGLLVTPPSTPGGESFRPAAHNWLRLAKVPNLMLNTTSLNTGHNWHFTVRWMGEPPGLTGDEIDMNERYRRVYYDEAPGTALQDYPLAYAVAASSCVPALFEPLPLQSLYDKRTVRLVDGGVHDNQGMAALLDDDCDFILCSDASGQMESQRDPANGLLGVFWRANSILQDRVREAQYRNICVRAEGGALQGLYFIHMKQDLDAPPVDYIGSKDARPAEAQPSLTPYGVDRTLQGLLSELRTDLDSFTEVESYALMASGYLLASHELRELDRQHHESDLPGHWGGFDIDTPMLTTKDAAGEPSHWPFAPLLPVLASINPESPRYQDLARQLAAGKNMFGRPWLLLDWLRRLSKGVVAALALLLAWAAFLGVAWFVREWDQDLTLASVKVGIPLLLACLVPLIALASLAVPALARLLPDRVTKSVALGLLVAVPAVIVSHLHLWIFEPLLRRRGRLARLLKLPA